MTTSPVFMRALSSLQASVASSIPGESGGKRSWIFFWTHCSSGCKSLPLHTGGQLLIIWWRMTRQHSKNFYVSWGILTTKLLLFLQTNCFVPLSYSLWNYIIYVLSITVNVCWIQFEIIRNLRELCIYRSIITSYKTCLFQLEFLYLAVAQALR